MQLSELQLECQKLWDSSNFHIWLYNHSLSDFGNPLRYDRLCYLRQIYRDKKRVVHYNIKCLWKEVNFLFELKPELYNQTILEWNDEVVKLVRDFLLSIS